MLLNRNSNRNLQPVKTYLNSSHLRCICILGHGRETLRIIAFFLCRYEVRMEACTLLGCAASDWSSIQTQEAPPAGQSAPLLELQADSNGMQTVFLLSWSPPAQANGKLLHYELYRRLGDDSEGHSSATLVYSNVSTSHHDRKLLPYTAYEYQVIHFIFLLFLVHESSFTKLRTEYIYCVQSNNRFLRLSIFLSSVYMFSLKTWLSLSINFKNYFHD